MHSNSEYAKKREKLINKALHLTLEYSEDIDDENNKNLFNRVFLNIMDRLAYQSGITTIKPREMSHEKVPY